MKSVRSRSFLSEWLRSESSVFLINYLRKVECLRKTASQSIRTYQLNGWFWNQTFRAVIFQTVFLKLQAWNSTVEAYSETCQTSKLKRFAKIVTHLLNIFIKRSILYVWQGFEYACGTLHTKLNLNQPKKKKT